MADIRVTLVIQTSERFLNSKLYVCSTKFRHAKLGAKVVPNKLFLAFLFSDREVGVQFLKDVGLIRSSVVCCKCWSQMSWCVDTNRKDGYRWRCRRITSASTSIRHGSWLQHGISWRFCSSHTTSPLIRTRLGARGGMWRHSSISTTGWWIISITWPTTVFQVHRQEHTTLSSSRWHNMSACGVHITTNDVAPKSQSISFSVRILFTSSNLCI